MTKMLTSPSRTISRCVISAVLCALPVTGSAFEQSDAPKPFDMAPETGTAPQPVEPAPAITVPKSAPVAPPVATEMRQPWRRYIVPSDTLPLVGEYYSRSWNIALTEEEAKAPARLNLGYQSAILVAPESSNFTVSVNNVELLQQPIRSSDQLAEVMVDVPIGILRTGANTFSIRAQQRHRTDCTVESTYELWTNIDPAKTYLAFDLHNETTSAQRKTQRFMSNEDIAAIGVNAKGSTQFNIIAPALSNGENGTSLLDLSQALAILGGMPNQSFSVEKSIEPALIHADGAQSGELTVLVGTEAELATVFKNLQIANANRGLNTSGSTDASMRFISNASTGEQFLLISGENWREINRNIDHLVALTERPANVMRNSLQTQNWNLPDAQLLRSATVLSFAELGIPTQQFSGRRLRNQFTFGVPADFYANAYGTATILLDAAYSAEVLPGSHIDIYVNGDIATTIPITSTGGGVMKQLPIRVEMRHFRPGLNTVTIEAALMTDADNACAAGSASSASPRFALFDTSKFKMPDFGRIGQTPNLAATAGMAYPYTYTTDVLPLSANLNDYNVLSASATIMGNLAIAAGRPLKIKHAQPEDDLKKGNALFIGAVTNLPDMVLAQTGLNPKAKGIWSDDDALASSQSLAQGSSQGLSQNEANYTLNQWQEQLQSGWSGRLHSFYTSVLKTFNVSDGLRLFPGQDAQYIPSKEISVLTAQGPSPSSTGAWTVVTAPDAVMLRQGVERLTNQTNWTKIDGRITSYNRENQAIETLPVQNIEFVATQPLSFFNIRLIATNWLSSNALSYVVVMLISLVALGLSTSMLLSRFGRRDGEE